MRIRQERADADVPVLFVLLELEPQGGAEPDHSVLRRRIGRVVERRDLSCDGADVDQGASALLSELPERQVAAVKGPEERRLDDLRVVVEGDRVEPPDRAGSCVVDPDVDPTVPGRRLTGELGDVDRIRDVRFPRAVASAPSAMQERVTS